MFYQYSFLVYVNFCKTAVSYWNLLFEYNSWLNMTEWFGQHLDSAESVGVQPAVSQSRSAAWSSCASSLFSCWTVTSHTLTTKINEQCDPSHQSKLPQTSATESWVQPPEPGVAALPLSSMHGKKNFSTTESFGGELSWCGSFLL